MCTSSLNESRELSSTPCADMLATPGNSACRFLRRTLNNCTRSLALEAVTVAEYEHTGRINVNPKEVIAGERRKTFLEEILQPNFKALLVDAAGTLLLPSEPAAEVYVRYATKHGVNLTERDALIRFREAYSMPWGESTIRYVGDGRPFWRHIVKHSTGSADPHLFEDIYEYYACGEAWTVSKGACESLARIRASGMKTAVVSNFDTRLRRIMKELDISHLFDAIVVSAEEGAEKPNPVLFCRACELLQVTPEEALHVGDDRRNDLYGARDAGCFAWLWGQDVHNFAEVERRLETRNYMDSFTDI